MLENSVYEGVPELLSTLTHHGMHLILTTSKPEVFAKQIMAHFDLAKYFDLIAGSSLTVPGSGRPRSSNMPWKAVG
jgi:phosphoglycolate phosphatase